MTQALAEEDVYGAGAEGYARILDSWLEPMLARLVELPRHDRRARRRLLAGLRSLASRARRRWTTLHTGTTSDARGSTTNSIENGFLGDYNSAWATNSGVFGAWNDARDASDCAAVDAWRQSLVDGTPTPKPAVQSVCPDTFGASSIYGGWYTP